MKLSPDKQFNPSLDKLTAILKEYNRQLVSYSEATSGVENRTVIAQTTSGKVVVRIYRQHKKKQAAIKLEVDFMNYLGQQGVPVPRVLSNSAGELVAAYEADGKVWQVIVMEYSEGEHATSYSPKLIKELATIQARMHQLGGEYPGTISAAHKLGVLQETAFAPRIALDDLHDNTMRALVERARHYKVALDPTLPRSLCHMDYCKDNVLSANDAITAVLDFDDLAYAPQVVCLANTLWDVYTKSGTAATKDYLECYAALRPLAALEYTYLVPAMLFRHYLVACLKIFYGHAAPHEVRDYLDVEEKLRGLTFKALPH